MTFSHFYLIGCITVMAVVSGCSSSKEITVDEFLDGQEKVQMQFRGDHIPENLVKEVRFYPNGNRKMVTPMKDQKVDGVVQYFYETGHLKEEVTFKNGVQEGTYKKYDDSGILVFEGTLTNGVKNGVWTTWYDEVQKEEERIYVNDLPDGTWTYWYIDGNLKREEVYENGKLKSEKEF